MRRNLWRAGLATMVMTGIAALAQVAPAQTVVEFESVALKRAVVEALGLESGAEVLDTDMLRLTELRATSSGIRSLSGLEYATNLEKLDISYNVVPNLYPLMTLANLRELDIEGIPDTDIDPLADLSRIEVLQMAFADVLDLTALAGLSNLRVLDARSTMVQDITPLAALTSLEVLQLSGSPVESLVPLEDLSQLTHLELDEVNTSDFGSLSGLAQLTHLQLRENGIADIRFLSAMTTLEYLDLTMNQIVDLSPLQGLNALRMVKLGRNQIEDLDPIFETARQFASLTLDHNQLNTDAFCIYLPALSFQSVSIFVSDLDGANRYYSSDFELACADPEGDADSDTLSNREEANLGTLPDNADTDADGHTDGAEQVAGSSPFDADDTPGAVVVDVPDIYLEHAIRQEAGRPTGPLFMHHLEQLKELHVGCDVESLEGLQYAINLEELSANCGSITDLSPIVALSSLKTLSLMDQEIEVLPDLSGLTSLKNLILDRNPLGSLAPLGELHTLERLELDDCGVSDASPIGRLTQLALLHMNNNPLDNIEFVSTMPNLQALQLDQCGITDIQPLAALGAVGVLSLRDNLIEDISPLRKVAQIQVLNLSNNRIREISALSGQLSLLMLYLEGNEISSVGALAYPRLLLRLDLSDNRIERAPALGFFRVMAILDLSSNLLRNISFLRGLRGLTTLDLSHNRIERIGILRTKLELDSVNLADNRIVNPSPALAWYLPIQSLRLQGNEISNLDAYVQNPYTARIEDFKRNPIPQAEFCLDHGIKQESEEEQYVNHLEVICSDPKGDLDSDGLANYDEFIAGSLLDVPDSDHDGFTDGEEVAADSYPWHQDSIPIDNPNTTPLPEMASILLARYDEFTTAPNRARLSYTDCQVALPGMTYQDFEALDENGSDGLSVWELELHTPKDSGCHLLEAESGLASPQRGDLAVFGLLLAAMAFAQARRNRNSDVS
jgi:Leucine-rich repeat (LRR) protein